MSPPGPQSTPDAAWTHPGPALSNFPKALAERAERILIVHGEEEARRWLAEVMMRDGYEVEHAAALGDALLAIGRTLPDLVLCDVDGPQAMVLEFCGDLRAAEFSRDVPVVLVSREPASEEVVTRGLLAGADDYVAAFRRPSELRARVRVHLRNKRYRDALRRVRGERETFRYQASVDPLTGVLNRRSLDAVVDEKVAAGEAVALLFIDVDHFKAVNDRFGHAAGDAVLRALADSLRRGTRSGDYCGRYGGEEFLVVASQIDAEQSRWLAERHRQAVVSLKVAETGGEPLAVSIGVAIFNPESGEDSHALLERADGALYAAKSGGRNRVAMAPDAPRVPRPPPSEEAAPSSEPMTIPRLTPPRGWGGGGR